MPFCPHSPPPPPPAITHLLSVSVDLYIGTFMSVESHNLAFCVWLLPLSTMFSRFIHAAACQSFVWLRNITLSGWTTFYSLIS